MEAKELRIGNYVLDRGNKVLRIDWWENINKVCMDMGKYDSGVGMLNRHPLTENAEYCRPIPLTEQWLLDFGFTDDGIVYMYDVAIDFKITLVPADGFYPQIEKASDTGWGCINLPKIDYVHQLQNFIYALTGEELTIKEKV